MARVVTGSSSLFCVVYHCIWIDKCDLDLIIVRQLSHVFVVIYDATVLLAAIGEESRTVYLRMGSAL